VIKKNDDEGDDKKGDNDLHRLSIVGTYFKFVNYAIENGNSSMRINVTYMIDGNDIWVIYSHFNGSIEHDPSIGVSDVTLPVGWIIAIAIVSAVVVIVVAIVLIVVLRKKYGKISKF